MLASTVSYGWGSLVGLATLAFCVALNWAGALAPDRGRRTLALVVLLSLAPLLYWKYLPFVVEVVSGAAGEPIDLRPFVGALPPGISFFTFQAIAYLVDVRRGHVEQDRRGGSFYLSVVFFPQLIAGPIVRFSDVASQNASRQVSLDGVASGLERFVVGLAKKLIVADTLAVPADVLFARGVLAREDAWLAVLAYSLQIYFDFSAYSDMAIGIGRICGFELPENFRAPYSARTMTEFWRRWHITLSSWFRDYVYIPLGGSRGSRLQTARNLFVVFFLCGLWHGASWTFIAWGLAHGALLSVERLGFGRLLERASAPLAHAYMVITLALTWVLFRADDLHHALEVYRSLFTSGLAAPVTWVRLGGMWAIVVLAAVGASGIPARIARDVLTRPSTPTLLAVVLRGIFVVALFILCMAALAGGSHHPFIYFQF